ncbi:MAG: ABC transporter permease [Gemmatimonadota bacterium]
MTFLRWLRSLVLHRRLERDMREEMRQHLDRATERLMARGFSREEARRAAFQEFGNVHYLQEEARDVRGARWLGALSPDAKLALRMLVKNPLLSIVGGLGMAVAICIAIGFFTWMTFYYAHPPIADGDRVVTAAYIRADTEEATLYDYLVWRDEVTTLEELSAYRRARVVAEAQAGGSNSANLASITASGLRLAGVPPLIGRPLLDGDERAGAAPVVVLGFDEWQQLFAGAPSAVGAELLLDGRPHAVVGVMPEGFRFPANDGLWIPLVTEASIEGPDKSPWAVVFGRLAPGVDAEAAVAELSAIAGRHAIDDARTGAGFRLMVLPFIRHLLDVQQYPPWLVWLVQLFAALILALVAVNVAVLVYARTALRSGEITVRTALGASRARIVSQLFLEALALSLAAAALGLAMAEIGFRQMTSLVDLQAATPYWLFGSLPAETVLYAIGLAGFAAFIVGVLPALQATGRHLQSTLRTMGGGTGVRLGKTWTTLICVQVAVAVGVLPAVLGVAWNYTPPPQVNFPASELLTIRVQPPADGSPQPERDYARLQAELLSRVDALPGVVGVSYASSIPMRGEGARVELDVADATSMPATPFVATHLVDPEYFDLLGVPLLAGRPLNAGDAAEGASAAIVSRSFVEQLVGDGNALGRRFRESPGLGSEIAPDAPWFEIVGVVEDMLTDPRPPGTPATFHGAPLGAERFSLVVRTRGIAPASLTGPVQALADQVGLGAVGVTPMDAIYRGDGGELRLLLVMVGVVMLAVLLLSAAGITAMMSLAVTRRQREIGVRTALGATRGQIIASIFRRSVAQLVAGIGVGTVVAVLLDRVAQGEMLRGEAVPLVSVVCTIMLLSGLIATAAPARRALRLQAMELLRDE